MKNVIITGTSSGLGFELVKKFNAENYNINRSIVMTQIPRDLSEC